MQAILQSYFDEGFQQNLCYAYNLSLLIGSDRLYYLIEDDTNHIVGLRGYSIPDDSASSVSKVFASDIVLRQSFRTVKVAMVNPLVSLVPDMLFDRTAEYKLYISNLVQEPEGMTVWKDELPEMDIHLVYYYPLALWDTILKFFPEAKLNHLYSALIRNWSARAARFDKPTVMLNILGRSIQLAVFDRKDLLYINMFSYQDAKGLLYYVLLVFQQLKLNPERTPLYIGGEITEDSTIFRELYKYIRQVMFFGKSNEYQALKGMQDTAPHFFIDLQAIKLCE